MAPLGYQTARRIIGGSNSTCSFKADFTDFPLYSGNPNSALRGVGAYYRFRNRRSRARAATL